jgi:hypothetical protein
MNHVVLVLICATSFASIVAFFRIEFSPIEEVLFDEKAAFRPITQIVCGLLPSLLCIGLLAVAPCVAGVLGYLVLAMVIRLFASAEDFSFIAHRLRRTRFLGIGTLLWLCLSPFMERQAEDDLDNGQD